MTNILIGPEYFFKARPDFVGKKPQYVTFSAELPENIVFKDITTGQRLISYRQMAATEYVKYLTEHKLSQHIGIFLVPEACETVGFKLVNLKKLDELIENSAEEWEKIIYKAYIKNKKFSLTEEQLAEAYTAYCTAKDDLA